MPQKVDLLPDLCAEPLRRQVGEVLSAYTVVPKSATYWDNQAPWDLPYRYSHSTFVLVPVVGVLDLRLTHRPWVEVPPGEFIILPPRTGHILRLKSGHERLEQISLHSRITDAYDRSLLERIPARTGRFPSDSAERWVRQFRLAAHLFHNQRHAGLEFLGISLKLFLIEMLSSGDPNWQLTTAPPQVDPRIAAAVEQIRAHPEAHHSVDALAAEQHITPVHFRKLFRKHMGIAPKAFITQIKMEHASHLLIHSRMRIQEVAHACGFQHAHHFHLRFKQHTGQTPADFRKAVTL